MKSTTKLAEEFIMKHASIRDCLRKRLINYSQLARHIAKELGIEKKTSMEAILIACRRYAQKISKSSDQEAQIQKVFRNSSIELKTNIAVIIIDKRMYSDNLISVERKIRKRADLFYAIEGTSAFTIIVSENYLGEIKKIFGRKIKKSNMNLAMITLKSSTDLEQVPGVMAQLFSLLSERGINIVECMSCWTDTIIIVNSSDVSRALDCLNFQD